MNRNEAARAAAIVATAQVTALAGILTGCAVAIARETKPSAGLAVFVVGAVLLALMFAVGRRYGRESDRQADWYAGYQAGARKYLK